MNIEGIVGIAAGTIGALVLFIVLAVVAYRIWMRKKTKKGFGDYEKIKPSMVKQPLNVVPGDRVTTVPVGHQVSMKTIPFTVPPVSTPPINRRVDFRSLDEASNGSGSEPGSPKRPSVELSGAYALGSIDPSLYKVTDEDEAYDIPAGHIGRIWFAVEYELESEKLLVTLIKAKNLPSRSLGSMNQCDPFVRIYLMPDERRYLQSKSRKKTTNPKFEESFVFQVPHKSFEERCLKLTMYDVDRHRRHQVIGHAVYPLKEHDSECNERVVIWRDLEREVSEAATDVCGELHVSLQYNENLERLTVGIFEGKNFKLLDGCSSVDTYVKVSLSLQSKMTKLKKTEVLKKTSDPQFNESFNFKLAASAQDIASINILAMQQVSGHKDRQIGRVVLGCFMFARGKELEHWNEMLSKAPEPTSSWHTLS
ncbi:synaptotagmin-15-like isoform X2 [Lineus longissimus]|uniref:synaptotagmin-15-like isoform X2 n=1 Tax=Lineus longissimus TaxID=88925 RepID=UPI002B4D630D